MEVGLGLRDPSCLWQPQPFGAPSQQSASCTHTRDHKAAHPTAGAWSAPRSSSLTACVVCILPSVRLGLSCGPFASQHSVTHLTPPFAESRVSPELEVRPTSSSSPPPPAEAALSPAPYKAPPAGGSSHPTRSRARSLAPTEAPLPSPRSLQGSMKWNREGGGTL